MKFFTKKKGFTLVELILVIAILIITTSAVFVSQGTFLVDTYLDSKTNEIAQTLKLAQMRSITRFNDDQWGVYFDEDIAGNNDKFVLFKGSDYATRDASFDITTDLPDSLSLSNIDLAGSGTVVVFDKVTGKTLNNGTIQLSDNQSVGNFNIVTINTMGLIALNESAGGGGGGGEPPPEADTTAPSSTTNLALSNATETSIDVAWTAPGDDAGVGTATSYDLRYSTSAINDGNWGAATLVTGEPAPSIAGSSESITVSGLTAATTYYFAIKTSDEIPNESAISNVPSQATTTPPPPPAGDEADSLVVDTNSIFLSNSDKYVRGITIQNSGDSGITIDKMTVSWTGGGSGNKIKKVRIEGGDVWNSDQNSGTLLDISDYSLTSGAAASSMDYLRFNKSMVGSNITVLFTMSDGSTKTISNIQP